MPDLWVDVDTAITVPVNILALTDDTDFKTRITDIVYNQAGMDLVWNFQTTAGVTTQTAVIPTTSGVYDWTHLGDGIYKIEIPDSGGASINNDTPGVGWFTGICDDVLHWRGPTIGFRDAELNNPLINNINVELAAVPTGSSSWLKKLEALFQLFIFQAWNTSSTQTMYKEDDNTVLGTATLSKDATTVKKGRMT